MEGTKEECQLMIDFLERHMSGHRTWRAGFEEVGMNDLLTFLRACKGRLVWSATLQRNRARQRERRERRRTVQK